MKHVALAFICLICAGYGGHAQTLVHTGHELDMSECHNSEKCADTSKDSAKFIQHRVEVGKDMASSSVPKIDQLKDGVEKRLEDVLPDDQHMEEDDLASLDIRQDASCAVCFIGQLRELGETVVGLRTKLLEPISDHVLLDVFVAAEQGGRWTIDTFKRNGIVVRDYTWRPHQSAGEIQAAMASKAPQAAMDHYKLTRGSWVAPLFGFKGNSLRFYALERDCINMIKRSEAANSKLYTWVIRTRPDFVWLVPHPPLSLTNSSRVWTFDSESWGGINGRHALGPRDMMLNLFDRMHLLEVGDPVVYLPVHPRSNDEAFLRNIARKFGAVFGTISYPAYLHPNPAWVHSGWRKPGTAYSSEQSRARVTAHNWSQPNACWGRVSNSHVDIHQCSHSVGALVGPEHSKVSRPELQIESEHKVAIIWVSAFVVVALAVMVTVAGVVQVVPTFCYSSPAVRVIASWVGMATIYILWVGLMPLINQYVMQDNRFPFPAVLNAMHMLLCSIATHVAFRLMPESFPAVQRIEKLSAEARSRFRGMTWIIAVLVVCTLVCENAALVYSPVGFLQIIKECCLFLVFALTIATQQDSASMKKMACIAMLVLGGGMCVHGSVVFVLTGFLLQCVSTSAKAFQVVLQGAVMGESSGLKLDPMSYMLYICPACLALLVPVAAVEVARASASAVIIGLRSYPMALSASCILALGTNAIVAMVVKRLNPIGFCCCGALKSAFLLAFSVFFLGEMWTPFQTLGCILILVAVPAYAWCKAIESETKPEPKGIENATSQAPSVQD